VALHFDFKAIKAMPSITLPTMPIIYFLGVLIILSPCAQARLGWTLEQAKKEYGEPKKIDGNKVSFLTSGGRTVNILLDPKGIVQAVEITPVTRDEALNFKNEYGIGWVTTDKYPDYAIIPDAEWTKNRLGEIHGIEWNYFPKNQLLLMNTEAGQIFLSKEKARNALNSPITHTIPEIQSPQGVNTIKQIKRIYVDSLGEDGDSRLLRERVRTELSKIKYFSVVDSPSEAQGIIQGAVASKGFTSAYGSSASGQAYVTQETHYVTASTLRVIDAATGKTLWTWEFHPARVSFGPFAFGDTSISKSFARDLSKEVSGKEDDEEEDNNSTRNQRKTINPRGD